MFTLGRISYSRPVWWELYEEAIPDGAKYFVDYWEFLLSNPRKIKLLSPISLLAEFLNEIELLNGQNRHTYEILKSDLVTVLGRDPVFKRLHNELRTLLLKTLNGKRPFDSAGQDAEKEAIKHEQNRYLARIVLTLKSSLKPEDYLKGLYENLNTELWRNDFDREKLEYLVESLIATLFHQGYAKDDLFKLFPEELIGNVHAPPSSLPAKLPCQQCFQNTLNELREPKNYRHVFWFIVNGVTLWGTGKDQLDFGSTKLHNPVCKIPLLDHEFKSSFEEYAVDKGIGTPILAEVHTESFEQYRALDQAKQLLSLLLDSCFYVNRHQAASIEILPGYLIEKYDGNKRIGQSTRVTNSIEIQITNEDRINSLFSTLFQNYEAASEYHQISRALRWYRKSVSTKNTEDQILNLWIALETLITGERGEAKLTRILEYCSYCCTPVIFRQEFLDMRDTLATAILHQDNEMMELAKRMGFTRKLEYQWLIDHLQPLCEGLKNQVLRRRMLSYLNLNSSKHIKILTDLRQEIKRNLERIYTVRNQITHSGFFSSSELENHRDLLHDYFYLVLNTSITAIASHMASSMEDVFTFVRLRFDRLIESLEQSESTYNLQTLLGEHLVFPEFMQGLPSLPE